MLNRRCSSISNSTRHILLINSDDLIQEMMQFCLEAVLNCKLIMVDSGSSAIAKASEQKIEAILLDFDDFNGDIADFNGTEIIRDLEQNPVTNSIPLVLLTSSPQSAEIIRLQHSAIFVIAKSFDLSNLANQISTLLGWK